MAINFKVNSEFTPLIREDKSVDELKSPSIRFQEQLSQVLNSTQQTEISILTGNSQEKFNAHGTVPKPELPAYIPGLNLQRQQLEENYHERILGLREYRQQVLASNIANADTPGYKARDFDILEAIRSGKTRQNVELLYTNSATNNVDGNTVSLDTERAKFMENALLYEYEVDRVKGEFKDMENLLRNLPY